MKTSPRILHVITAFDRGGAENHLADLVRHQAASGMEVTVAYLRGRGSLAASVAAESVAVHRLALRFYGDPRPLSRLRQLIANGGFHLVHAHLPPAELYVRLALLGTPANALPLIISKHNDCPFHRAPGERLVDRWVSRRAAAMIVISDAVACYMTARGVGQAPCRSETIHYGIDPTPFDQVSSEETAQLRRDWGVHPDTLLVGFVGRLVSQKSIDVLIRAFAEFLRTSGCDAKLAIVGEGPLGAELQESAAREGIADRVIWPGFREDVAAVMGAFDVFALTSSFEGFGLVLIEAMAAGAPIVATRVSAIPEVVVDGESGLLAEPGSSEGIARALTLLVDPALRRRLGLAGYERVRRHFTLERMWRATDAVYEQALSTVPNRNFNPAALAPAPG
ncbi:MAG TPA: glycosyltransferase family 4 protein [Chthoniobacterales bacterium]